MPTPQFWQVPPLKIARLLDELVIVVNVVPLIRSTFVVFSVQTTSEVDELAAQEFTTPGVGKTVALALPSSGTCAIPVVLPPHQPNGTYAVTLLPATTASELVGTHEAKVVFDVVTVIAEQLGVLKVLKDVVPAVPKTHAW